MKITGTVNIPKGTGYFPGGCLTRLPFADLNSYAATATQLYSIPEERLQDYQWELFILYAAFNVHI